MSSLINFSSYFRYSLFGIIYISAALFNLSLCLIVLLKNRVSPLNRSFFYVTGAAFIWTFSIGMIDLAADAEKAHFWLRTQYFFGVPFISPSVYLFSSRWIGRTNKFLARLGFIFAGIAMVLYTCFADSAWYLKERPWGRYPNYVLSTYGIICITFLLSYFFIYAFLGFWNVYLGWKSSTNSKERAQFRNVLIAFLLAYSGSFDFVAAFDINVVPIGAVSLTILVSIIAYTMLKHEFLDINLLLKKGVFIVLIYSALLAITLPFAALFAHGLSIHMPTHPITTILGTGLIFGTILSFGPIIYSYLTHHSFWLRDTLSTGLAHELKSPLTTIQGALDLLAQQSILPEPNREKTAEYLSLMQKNTDRLEKHVKDLLNLAQIQKGEVNLNKTPTDIIKLIKNVMERFQLTAEKKGLHLVFNFLETGLLFIDPEKIDQAISNLVSNAIKFSEKGEITVNLTKEAANIRISVSDQGCGIKPENLSRVFDRFFQEGNLSRGSGIGLTIAKAWIEAHGGKIWAESGGGGKGAKMIFMLLR